MSDEKQETLADIVREMRERLDHAAEDRYFGIMEQDEMFSWADRIEAVAKRERKPRRNCDRFKTAEEAELAYARTMPPATKWPINAFARWLFAPAEESEVAE